MKSRLFSGRTPSFADLLPYAGLVANGVILLKNGALMAGWYFAGPDSESSTDLERNQVCRHLNMVLARLGNGWMIQVEAIRIPVSSYPRTEASFFPDPVTLAIENERREHFEAERGHFESQHAIILTYLPPGPTASGFSRYLYAAGPERAPEYADTVLNEFDRAIREVEQQLSHVLSIRRMQTRSVRHRGNGRTSQYDELFQFIRFCIGGVSHPVRLPDIPMYLDHLVTAEFEHGLAPRADGQHLAVIGIDGLPAESWPGILNGLDLMPLSYRWSTRFIFLDEHQARDKLERTRKKWQQKTRPFFDQLFQTHSRSVDQDALAMVGQTEDAISQAASKLVAFGYYTPVIVIFGHDEAALGVQAETVRSLIQGEGFGARIETLNATEAYLGSLPGNGTCNVRAPLINTANLSDLIPINTVWAGASTAPCPFYPIEAPPLMLVASGSTPFRLNLHVDDVGHCLVFGPTGSGKSTLLALIAAQFRRYEKAQIFCFDKGRSLLPLTRAAGGNHYEVGAGGRCQPAFCPLSQLSTPADRAWASEWVETLLAMQGVGVTPSLRNAISRQIVLMATSSGRSLSDFVSGVQSQKIKEALRHYTIDGPMGYLLDAEEDGLTLGKFETFEIEELMNMGERNLVPVLTYLFHRIEQRLTGAPSLIILDEAWIMLGHPTFSAKIREWLKVLRKANCAVILATQSISDAERSGIVDVLKESCPTKICLPNGSASDPGIREFYERLGFNDRQIHLIAQAIPKREYYVASPAGRRLFEMSLGPIALAFTGASSRQDLQEIEDLMVRHGAGWPSAWLAHRGISAHVLEQ